MLEAVAKAMRQLSMLGAVQAAILSTNVALEFAALAAGHPYDHLMMLFGAEFVVLSAVCLLYTITVENQYAFWWLVGLQFEEIVFMTSATILGFLNAIPEVVRWALVAIFWALFITFLMLQRFVRKTWGWHAFHTVGTASGNISLFAWRQMLAASLLADAVHSIFFVTIQQVFVIDNTPREEALIVVCTCIALALAYPFLLCVKREHRIRSFVLFLLYCVGLAGYAYFAARAVVSFCDQNMAVRSSNFPVEGQRLLVVIVLCVVGLVRLITIVVAACNLRAFGYGLDRFFQGEVQREYLITDEQVRSTRKSLQESRRTRVTQDLGDSNGIINLLEPAGSTIFTEEKPVYHSTDVRSSVGDAKTLASTPGPCSVQDEDSMRKLTIGSTDSAK